MTSQLKSILGGSIGNLVEWYDWYAYSAFAVYFSGSFFPGTDKTAELLNTAGIFALGFLVRPIGGWLFGRIADKHGRKKAMTSSVLLMSFGSLLIAILPTYSTIGVAAPVLLTVARLLQGLSVGGEYGVSATYLSEMAGTRRRGFFSSFQYVTLVGGQLVALGLQIVLQNWLLTEDQIYEWGWRIPFVVGALLALVALYLRSNLEETKAFESAEKNASPDKGTLRELLRHPRAILQVVGLTMGGTLAFYTYTTYMQKFLVNTAKFSNEKSTLVAFVSLLVFVALQPLLGALSDRVGRRPLLIAFGVLGSIFTIPLMSQLEVVSTALQAFLFLMAGLIIVSGYTSINAVVKAELFPARIRALGVGLPYAVTVALFGGTAEYIALRFKQAGFEQGYYYYVTCCIAFSLLVYLFMRETKDNSEMED